LRGTRRERLEHQLRKEIGDIVEREVRDPAVGFSTVTEVRLSNDLQFAKVYVSVYGDRKARDDALRALGKATAFVRSQLGRRIRVKTLPEITFLLDESLDTYERVEELLEEIDEENGKE
jgi:ribosome-binding factor A